MQPTLKQRKQTWFLIVFAISAQLPLLSSVLIFNNTARVADDGSSTPIIALAIGFVALLASTWWALTKVRPKQEIGGAAQLQPVAQFQTNSIVSLALAEAGVLVVLTMTNISLSSQIRLAFVGIAMAVIALVIVPSGIAYWKLAEEQEPR